MANLKISELASATPASGDQFPVARGSGNYKIDYGVLRDAINGAFSLSALGVQGVAVGGDQFLIERAGIKYKVDYAALKTDIAAGASVNIGSKGDLGTGLPGGLLLVERGGTQYKLDTGNLKRAPDGPVLIEFGLSLLDFGYFPNYGSGGDVQIRGYRAKGFIHWLKRRLGAPFHILHNAGKSGDTFAGMLGRIDADVINRSPRPTHCLICAGGNEMRVWRTFNDAEAGLAAMEADFEAIITRLKAANILPIVLHLVHNGAFAKLEGDSVGHVRDYGQFQFRKYLRDYCRANDVHLLNADGALERPLRQEVKAATYSRAGTGVVTATVTAHGYSTGDHVIPHLCGDTSFDLEPALANPVPAITVLDANTYTYTSSNTTVASTTGKAVRVPVFGDLFDEGAIHYNARGASKMARVLENQMRRIFPREQDFLITHSGDFDCLINPSSSGVNYFRVSSGMLSGTAGTDGTNVTGDVADSWTCNVLTSANATATASNHSVVCSKVPFTDEVAEWDGATTLSGEWQRMVISGGTADSIVEFYHVFGRPGQHAVSFAYTLGQSVRPSGASENGFFYVCTTAGTTGAVAPTWPTRPGERVVDGGVVWECRNGFKLNDLVYAGAEYRIVSLDKNATSLENEALQVLSFGIWKSTATNPGQSTDTAAIMDWALDSVADATPIPLYEEGEHGVFLTPIAPLTDVTDTRIGVRMRVAAGKAVTLDVRRITARKVS